MLFIKGGKIIASILFAVNLDSLPIPAISVVKDKIFELFTRPANLIQQ